MISKFKHIGKWNIFTEDGEEIIFNRLTNTGIQELINALQGNSDIEIKYLALGTSNTPLNDTDTTLGNEIFRTPYVDRDTINFNELRHKFVVLDNEATVQIEEIGIFCGDTATATANTGKMLSRILWSRDKTTGEEITFIRTDKIERG